MLQFCRNSIKINNYINKKCNLINYCLRKHYCDNTNNYKKSFEELTLLRRDEASRSILIQVHSENSYNELSKYCSQFGEIKDAFHYNLPQEELNYILIEYSNAAEAANAIDSSCMNEDCTGVPVRSPFLWFKAGPKTKIKVSKSKQTESQHRLSIINGNKVFTENDILDNLLSANNLDDQIIVLHKLTCLNDLGVRLRYMAAKQIEMSVSGMFPKVNAYPFGSSVNGFGKLGCDLDLILKLDSDINKDLTNSRLVYHTKENLSNGRSQIQRQMETLGDMLQIFLPGVSHVRRILQARVPIIKYHHDHLDLEVDLSMGNLSGVYMSELLFMFGELDERVRPLTFCIRRWALSTGLTNPSPGRWLSNFSLTLLVIFFMQQTKHPILPPINSFINKQKKDSIRITDEEMNCMFLHDINQLKFKTQNTDNLGQLLLQFFEFYSQFDFHSRAISLNEGKTSIKPDHSAIYIVNPLESVLNVSKNVSLEEMERFRIEVRNAAWILESSLENNNSSSWGLINVFKAQQSLVVRPQMFFRSRMVDVSELFDEPNDNKKIEFKDPFVKSQVDKIKKTKNQLNYKNDASHRKR